MGNIIVNATETPISVSLSSLGPQGAQGIKGDTGVIGSTGVTGATGVVSATLGTATLVGGTVTVSTSAVTSNSVIFLTHQSLGTVLKPVAIGVTEKTIGVSFVITSMDITDTSTVAWMIMEV